MKKVAAFLFFLLMISQNNCIASNNVASSLPIEVGVTIVPPACTVTAQNDFDMGTRKPNGWGSAGTLVLNIDCPSAAPSSIVAQAIKGRPIPKNGTPNALISMVNSNNVSAGEAITLEMIENGHHLIFDGVDSVCSGSNTRTCSVELLTATYSDRGGNLSYGQATATVRFTLVYS